jgi:hypothetical protein
MTSREFSELGSEVSRQVCSVWLGRMIRVPR